MKKYIPNPGLLALVACASLSAGSALAQYLPTFPAGNASAGALLPGTDLVRFWLGGPDVLCNDGSQPAMYLRRGAAGNDDKWIVYLQGGGTCGDGQECFDRWQSVGTNFGLQQMSTSVSQANWTAWHPAAPPPQGFTAQGADYAIPTGIVGRGIFAPVAANPFATWNHAHIVYCSSDAWTGERTDQSMTVPAPYVAHFRGATIFDAAIAQLRGGVTTYCLNQECRTMPDLDNASFLLLAGESAGGNGVKHNLDRLASDLRVQSPNIEVRGLIDAAATPFGAALPWGATTPMLTWETYLQDRWNVAYLDTWNARVDASCLTENPTPVQHLCADPTHVLRHHVTTPFFARMDLQDELGVDSYEEQFYTSPSYGPTVAEGLFARGVSRELADVSNLAVVFLPRYPAELATVAADPRWIQPAVFGPRCTNHVGLTANGPFFNQNVLDMNGLPINYVDALFGWVNLAPAGLAGPRFFAIEPAGVGALLPPHC